MDNVADRIAWSERILANLTAQIGSALPRIISGLILILLFLALAWVVRRIFRRIARRFDVERRPLFNLGAEAAWFTVITSVSSWAWARWGSMSRPSWPAWG
jgi:hypothetical protein